MLENVLGDSFVAVLLASDIWVFMARYMCVIFVVVLYGLIFYCSFLVALVCTHKHACTHAHTHEYTRTNTVCDV